MKPLELLQLVIFIFILLALTKPMGLYISQILDPNRRTFMIPVLSSLEQFLYRLARVDQTREQDWVQYSYSLMIFSLIGVLFTYAILRLQHLLPLNPQGFGPLSEHLAFNTAVSFATNTNWQSYGGETTLSYFSQMVGLTLHNFVSAASGISVAAALVRGIARNSSKTIGNFWVDLIRINLYLLLPFSFVLAIFMSSQGTIQNFMPYVKAYAVEQPEAATPEKGLDREQTDPANGLLLAGGGKTQTQTIGQGPIASQVAIKILGTNGGGFVNANSAHPFENPTPLSNFLQMLSIFLIPSGLTYYLGRMVKNQAHGWTVWTAMALLFVFGAIAVIWAEEAGNPRLHALGLDVLGGNMEGKEVRFGIGGSALFATITTAASCGAVNAMLDSFTPIGGLVAMLNIQLGEVIFGGVGAGLYGILVFVVLTVFLAGLMIGRTPEYLGKKIEARDVKLSVFFVLVPILSILGFSAWAVVSDWGIAGLRNAGPHGLTEILYAYSSATGNNGSAFAGLNTDTCWYNTTLGVSMLIGRFFLIMPVLALAGNLARKRSIPQGSGSFPISGPTFAVLLSGTILIVGALSFFPALSLSAILEQFLMHNSTVQF